MKLNPDGTWDTEVKPKQTAILGSLIALLIVLYGGFALYKAAAAPNQQPVPDTSAFVLPQIGVQNMDGQTIIMWRVMLFDGTNVIGEGDVPVIMNGKMDAANINTQLTSGILTLAQSLEVTIKPTDITLPNWQKGINMAPTPIPTPGLVGAK